MNSKVLELKRNKTKVGTLTMMFGRNHFIWTEAKFCTVASVTPEIQILSVCDSGQGAFVNKHHLHDRC